MKLKVDNLIKHQDIQDLIKRLKSTGNTIIVYKTRRKGMWNQIKLNFKIYFGIDETIGDISTIQSICQHEYLI